MSNKGDLNRPRYTRSNNYLITKVFVKQPMLHKVCLLYQWSMGGGGFGNNNWQRGGGGQENADNCGQRLEGVRRMLTMTEKGQVVYTNSKPMSLTVWTIIRFDLVSYETYIESPFSGKKTGGLWVSQISTLLSKGWWGEGSTIYADNHWRRGAQWAAILC